MLPGSHPNAALAVYMGAVSVLVLYGAGVVGLGDPPAEVGAALTTVLTGVALLVGRRAKPAEK